MLKRTQIHLTGRPPALGVQEDDPSSQGVKRRLPQEVKQKLAKVARLAVSKSFDDMMFIFFFIFSNKI